MRGRGDERMRDEGGRRCWRPRQQPAESKITAANANAVVGVPAKIGGSVGHVQEVVGGDANNGGKLRGRFKRPRNLFRREISYVINSV